MSGDDMIKLYWKVVSFLLLFAVVVFLGLNFVKGTNKKEAELESTTENISLMESVTEPLITTEAESLEEENPLLKDAIFEINKLMEWFFQAKFDCDIETLQQIVSPSNEYQAERLHEERYGKDESGLLEIESYFVKSCYSKRGLLEGTFFVWVLVEVKYVNAETTALALYRMYVCKGENGYYINHEISEEEAAYRDEISEMEDVQKLIEEVNQQFQEAVNQDEQLKNIVLTMEGTDSKSEEMQSSEEVQSSAEVQ